MLEDLLLKSLKRIGPRRYSSQFREGWKFRSYEDLLLSEGSFYRAGDYDTEERSIIRRAFLKYYNLNPVKHLRNPYRFISSCVKRVGNVVPNFYYCEGYTVGPRKTEPIPLAWALLNRKVIDVHTPTEKEDGARNVKRFLYHNSRKSDRRKYFGVRIPLFALDYLSYLHDESPMLLQRDFRCLRTGLFWNNEKISLDYLLES